MTKFFILTAISYDYYVAICKSLYYTTLINRNLCTLLVLCEWPGGFLTIFPFLMFLLYLYYCPSSVIDHFACDGFPFTAILLRYMTPRNSWFLLCYSLWRTCLPLVPWLVGLPLYSDRAGLEPSLRAASGFTAKTEVRRATGKIVG